MRCDMRYLALVLLVVVMYSGSCSAKKRRDWPPGVNSKMIPAPTFDEDAPTCGSHEACGFYSFTLKNRHLRWIKSWCKCSDDYECVYDRTDLKMRVYRQICRSKDDSESEENAEEETAEQYQEAQLNQEQQHLAESARKRRALFFLRELY